jgi:hypothetical protein
MVNSSESPPALASASADGAHVTLADAAELDRDLQERLAVVTSEEAGGDERFRSSRIVLIECLLWLVLAAALWVVTMLLWR